MGQIIPLGVSAIGRRGGGLFQPPCGDQVLGGLCNRTIFPAHWLESDHLQGELTNNGPKTDRTPPLPGGPYLFWATEFFNRLTGVGQNGAPWKFFPSVFGAPKKN